MPALSVHDLIAAVHAHVHDTAAALPTVGHSLVAGLATIGPILTEEFSVAFGPERAEAMEAEALDRVYGVAKARLYRLPHGDLMVKMLDDHLWPLARKRAEELLGTAPGSGAS
jgi:hypothetical protein